MACKNIVTERGGDMSVTRNGRCIYTNLTFRLQLEDNSSVDLVGDSQLELSTHSQLWSQTWSWWIGLELRHELDRSWTGVGVELATVKPPIHYPSRCVAAFTGLFHVRTQYWSNQMSHRGVEADFETVSHFSGPDAIFSGSHAFRIRIFQNVRNELR